MRRLDSFMVTHEGVDFTVEASRVDDISIVTIDGVPGGPWFAQVNIITAGRIRVVVQRSKGWPLPVLGLLHRILSEGPVSRFVLPKPDLSVVDGGAA